jgi:hypothetical protein
VILSKPLHWGKNANRQTAQDGDAFIVGFGTIIGVRWEGLEVQEVSAGLSNNPSRSDRDKSVSADASVAICFGFDLFQRTLAERTNVAVWS